jgi:hypothetical protein
MASDLTIARDVAEALEPDETLRAEVHNHEPQVYDAEVLYLWVRRASYGTEDSNQGSDRHHFELGVAWLTPTAAVGDFDTDVSELIDDKVMDLVDLVRANRGYTDAGSAVWEWLQVDAVDYDRPVTNDARGFEMTLSGWRYEI